MKKLLLVGLSFLLLIVGCAWKITHVNTEKIRKECKIECQSYELSSDDWCNCIQQCINNEVKGIDDEINIYVEECSSDSTNN